MSRMGNRLQEKFMSMKFRGYGGYDERDDTKEKAENVPLTKAVPVIP